MKTPGLNRAIAPVRTSDADLVARCCAGDRAAWRSLYERHAALVYRFLSALGIRDPEREDACQDVFLAVYRSLPSFRGESQLSTWIYRITARTTGKLIQKRRLRNALATVMLSEPTPPPPDPSEETTRSLLLDRMLDRLHPKKRLVLVLFELEGVPVEEIARIADCPTNTVWSRLHHARLDLTKMAEREGKRRGGAGFGRDAATIGGDATGGNGKTTAGKGQAVVGTGQSETSDAERIDHVDGAAP